MEQPAIHLFTLYRRYVERGQFDLADQMFVEYPEHATAFRVIDREVYTKLAGGTSND